MTDHLETLLRDALDDLATSTPTPTELAGPALRRARRQRSRRAALASSATALLVAAAISVGAVAISPPEPTLPIKLPRPNMILSYCGMVDSPTAPIAYTRLWNPATGAYDRMPYGCAVPSPDGRQALVTPPRSFLDGTPPPPRFGIWDRRSGQVRWFDLPPQFIYQGVETAWSPDGKRLLLTRWVRGTDGVPAGPTSMVLIDPETLQVTEVPLASAADIESTLTWRPDGQHVATALRDAHIKTRGLGVWDLSGHLERTIPATGLMFGYWYSPDGSLMALWSDRDRDQFIVADATTGAERSRLPLPRFGQFVPELLGWYDNEHLAFIANRSRPSEAPATLHVEDVTGQPTGAFDVDFTSPIRVYGPPPPANR